MSLQHSVNRYPKAWTTNVTSGEGFGSTNLITFANTCVSIIISNQGSTYSVNVQLNGDPGATFNIPPDQTFSFGAGEFYLSSIDFALVQSGTSGASTTVVVVASLER
jgi:hypothetical protein